ncbi:MAG: hypothetical protein AAFR93_02525 [Pseudomonadota bacterium]
MTIRFDYDPKDPITQRIGKQVHGQWRSLTEMIAIAIMLAILFALTRYILGFFVEDFRALSPQLPLVISAIMWGGIALGLVAAYMVMVAISRYRDLRRDQENELSGYRKGPITVELSERGISTRSVGRAEQVPWSSAQSVKMTPLGIGIALDDREYIPIGLDQLPQGMTGDEAMTLIETWRKSD